jgi:hypothetical protein
MAELGERVAALEERVRTVTGGLAEIRDRHEDIVLRVVTLEREHADAKAIARAAGEAAARANRWVTRSYALAGLLLTLVNVLVAKGVL